MFRWDMDSDQYVAPFRCGPELKADFQTKDDRATMRGFFANLAQHGKVNVAIDCHNIKRVKPKVQ